METWKPIPLFEGYEVSDTGEVRSFRSLNGRGELRKTPRPLKIKAGPYKRVGIYRDSKLFAVTIHSLVLSAFVSARPDKKECNHKDGDKYNNNLSNLEWVSKKENIIHSRMVLGKVIGENNPHAKLKYKDVKWIRDNPKMKLADMAKVLSVCISTVERVRNNKNWLFNPETAHFLA